MEVTEGNRKIRVLYLEESHAGTIGGSHHSLYHLIKEIDKQHYQPVVAFYEENQLLDQFRDLGATIHILRWPANFRLIAHLPRPLRFLDPARKRINSLCNFGISTVGPALARLKWLRKHEIGLVHLNNSPFAADWVLAAKWLGIPCVAHLRGMRKKLDPFPRKLAARLDTIFCISSAVYESLVACGCAEDNLFILHNGIDPVKLLPQETPHDVRRRLKVKDSVPLVGMVGNLKRWKGQHVLVRALAEVQKRLPGTVVVFIGAVNKKDVPYFEALKGEIASLGLEEQVIFTGYTDRVPDYISAMDVVVHASIEPEPFGRVIIEAMAMSKPIIASRAGGVVEIIDEPETGLMFTPGDSGMLADKLVQVLTDSALIARMGQKARNRAMDKFHIRRNAEQTCAVYEKLLKGKRRRGLMLVGSANR